jgi:MoaA/NifB/PqqE/SkfB family radical SAM enzyme
MNRKFYSRIIKEMRDVGVEELGVFFIGESFLCQWLPEAIAEAKDIGYPYVFLTTNGSAAKPNKVKACMEAGLDSLKFSLNFYEPGQLASVAKVNEENFYKAVEAVKNARRIRDEGKFDCGIYASSIAFDGEQGERMRALVAEIEPFVDEHYWLPLFSMREASVRAGMKPTVGNPGRLAKMRDPLPCWSAFTEAHITKDGKLVACCFGAGLDSNMVMADLNKVSFEVGWNSVDFQKLREAHLNEDVTGTPCESCVAAR